MPIRSFEFQNLETGWMLERTSFDDLNLLVGVSGVGKTQILEALRGVASAALVGAKGRESCSWTLTIEASGVDYQWTAETLMTRYVSPPSLGERVSTDARFVREKIRKNKEIIVNRDQDFVYQGRKLPKLESSESAIKLLQAEESIRPIYSSFAHWLFMDLPPGAKSPVIGVDVAEQLRQSITFTQLCDSDLQLVAKLYIVQKDYPELFKTIEDDYIDIFPTVQEIRVATYLDFGIKTYQDDGDRGRWLTFGIREEGVEDWIVDWNISAGMKKVLDFLSGAHLAPPGTVFIIDELENGLGINCLPEVAGHMLKGLDRVQYIATSHHPRVIHAIPYKRWKLVTRQGSAVRVLPASDINALRDASPLERFTELLNLPEYVEGVA